MMKPTSNHVLIKVDEPEATTGKEGLIIVPEQMREASSTGTVTAIGPNVTDVKPNDRVLISTFSGTETPDGLVMRDWDVLALLVD